VAPLATPKNRLCTERWHATVTELFKNVNKLQVVGVGHRNERVPFYLCAIRFRALCFGMFQYGMPFWTYHVNHNVSQTNETRIKLFSMRSKHYPIISYVLYYALNRVSHKNVPNFLIMLNRLTMERWNYNKGK